jgi:hypothetical protein
MELDGTEEQVDLYQRMIEKEAAQEGGTIVEFSGQMLKNTRDLVAGAGIKVNRMFNDMGGAVISVLPMSNVALAREKAIQLGKVYNMKDPYTKEEFAPPMFIVPNDRGTNAYLELDIPIAAAENHEKLLEYYRELSAFINKEYHGSTMSLRPWFEPMLLPAYAQLVRDIKDAIDPNKIFQLDRLLKVK